MSVIGDINAEPWRFDFFAVMRRIERSYPERPRIGDSSAHREDYVALGQNPYMDFPASNLSAFERRADGRFRVLVKSPRGFDLSAYLRTWLAAAPRHKGNLKLEIDVDPQSFL